MQSMHYIGLDVHKRTISYCVKDASGRIQSEGTIPAKHSIMRSGGGGTNAAFPGRLPPIQF